MAERWSPFHLRLHRFLLSQPDLLPREASLLLAVSGGQDSMALTGLLLDLRRLHHWRLELWHGDHHWRSDSAQHARALAQWAQGCGLRLHCDRWSEATASEASARQWRYSCLERLALARQNAAVVTGHTASDRAETLLLNLARGCHRRGMASLPVRRPLPDSGLPLVRPLLIFSRAETAAICEGLGLPVWLDSSNGDPHFSRNRIRQEVLPVLNALHPGVERRLSGLAERLAREEDHANDLLKLALQGLRQGRGLDRRTLLLQKPDTQRQLLRRWLELEASLELPARQLSALVQRLQAWERDGEQHLAHGWRLQWQGPTLWLCQPGSAACDEPHA